METIISQISNRRNFIKGIDTIEVGYPWLTYGAIMAIELLVKPTDKVLELGCGGSTIFWSKKCSSVKTYDPEPEWVNKVKDKLPKPSNVTWVVGNAEELVDAVKKEPNEYYDWLLVDISNSYRFRLRMANESVSKLKKGGFLVVDNYAARFIHRFDYTNWNVYTFDDMTYYGRGTRIAIKP